MTVVTSAGDHIKSVSGEQRPISSESTCMYAQTVFF